MVTSLAHRNLRYPAIDGWRGIAIVLMVVYHFLYDLDVFGYIDTQFGVGYWIPFRYVIVILFLFLVGISLQIAHGKRIRWKSVKLRSLQLLAASLAVTISSYFIAPSKVTVFGILQLILIASWLGLLFLNRPALSLVFGVFIFVVGHWLKTPFFEPISLHWLGMVENKRPALDYAPVFPWFGIVLLGITAGCYLEKSTRLQRIVSKPTINFNGFRQVNALLEWAGKHSLVIYLIHQPVLFGLLMVVSS